MNALILEIMATWMLLWKEQWCLFFSQQKGTQFKCRAPLILGALLFFMNPSGCALLDNDFPEPLQGIAYSRLSFVFIFLLFQHERNTFSCPIIRNMSSQKSKAALKTDFQESGGFVASRSIISHPIISVQLIMRAGCKPHRHLLKVVYYSVLKFQDSAGIPYLAADLLFF